MTTRHLRQDWPCLLPALGGAICISLTLVWLGLPERSAELLALFIATSGYGWALFRRREPELSKAPGAFSGIMLGSLLLLVALLAWRMVGRAIFPL